MGIGSGIAIAGAVGATASVGGAVIGANAAGNAASTQAGASEDVAQLQYESEQQALQFQEQEFAQQQQNIQPWLQTGGSAELEMAQLLGLPAPTSGATPAQPFAGSTATANPSAPVAPTPSGPNGWTARNLTQLPGGSTLSMSNLAQPNGAPVQATRTSGPVTPGQAPAAAANPNAANLQPFAPWTTPFNAPTIQQAEQ